MTDSRRLVVVANRLPVSVKRTDEGPEVRPSAGGLVSALQPVLAHRGGSWVGWLEGAETWEVDLDPAAKALGCELHPVSLPEEEVAGYYEGFANAVLWPLFHDFVGHCNFDPAFWGPYQRANRRFAERVAEVSNEDDVVWIQDYHLLLLARELRALEVKRDLGFFLHIPFPALDIFEKMPWRKQILEGMLQFDTIGFQTPRDLRNFLQCVIHRVDYAKVKKHDARMEIQLGDRAVRAGAFPISIDYESFLHRAVDNEVSELVAQVRMQLPGRALILGLDRLDYSKGIPHRIRALGDALDRYPDLRGKVTLLQVVVPSRTRVDEYRFLKDEIDRLVGMINGRHTRAGWTPIQYIFRELTQTELLAYYRACDIALITPLKDGMNLVAKEYCACSLENNGVLILSEFAGAASQLGDGALIVNPFDINETADAINQAVTMPDDERRERMQQMREQIRDHDIFGWVDSILG